MIGRDFCLEDPQYVIVGFAGVYREGFSKPDGLPELANENGLLDITRGVVVMVVEAYFSQSHTAGMLHSFETESWNGGRNSKKEKRNAPT